MLSDLTVALSIYIYIDLNPNEKNKDGSFFLSRCTDEYTKEL